MEWNGNFVGANQSPRLLGKVQDDPQSIFNVGQSLRGYSSPPFHETLFVGCMDLLNKSRTASLHAALWRVDRHMQRDTAIARRQWHHDHEWPWPGIDAVPRDDYDRPVSGLFVSNEIARRTG